MVYIKAEKTFFLSWWCLGLCVGELVVMMGWLGDDSCLFCVVVGFGAVWRRIGGDDEAIGVDKYFFFCGCEIWGNV